MTCSGRRGISGASPTRFLVVASKTESARQTVFAKYNRTRREEFAIRTTIVEEDGRRFVEKTALNPAGSWHILSFEKK